MQMVARPDFRGRFLYYWSNTYSSQLKQGNAYDLLRPVISICFVDGILFPGNDECHLRFRLLETASHFPFNEDLDLHVFQLPQFTKSADDLQTDLDLWLYVLNNGRGLDLASLPRRLRVVEVEEALEALAVLTQDRIQREIYEAREKARRDEASSNRHNQRLKEEAERAQKEAERAREEAERAREEAERAREEGPKALAKGESLGRIRVYEEFLHRTPRPDTELAAMSADELRQLAEDLRSKWSAG
jgi:predicted transposase/invertase (TIGR01784 family)